MKVSISGLTESGLSQISWVAKQLITDNFIFLKNKVSFIAFFVSRYVWLDLNPAEAHILVEWTNLCSWTALRYFENKIDNYGISFRSVRVAKILPNKGKSITWGYLRFLLLFLIRNLP